MLALMFPPLDPVLVHIGPLAIRWYALAYIAGFIGGWRYCQWLARQNPAGPTAQDYDDFLTWAVIGTVLGGRIGYILFYQFAMYLEDPLQMLQIWKGGMSFHGGMVGVILAGVIFTRQRNIRFFAFTDLLACAVPIGLGLGRLGNFVNGELFGRVTDAPWGIIFPHGGPEPRHPSQLYEAGLEGLALLIILGLLAQRKNLRVRDGLLSGAFLALYGAFRFMVEFFREPDSQLGFLYGGATMGQMLCLPMIVGGAALIVWACRRDRSRLA